VHSPAPSVKVGVELRRLGEAAAALSAMPVPDSE
jgi:hypothetical protein